MRPAGACLLLVLAAGCSAGDSLNGGGGGGPAPPTGGAATGAYLPDAGLIVVEFESGSIAGNWAEETALTGFQGLSYVRWAGPNHYSEPGNDAFGFDFYIEDAGTYNFRIHNRHDHADSTLANDAWIKVDDGPWVKTFSWQRGVWNFETQHEFSHSNKPPASYALTQGNHRIEFSGRSTDFCMDRFHLYNSSVVDPLNTSHPESTRSGVSGATAGSGGAGMIGMDSQRSSLVELDVLRFFPQFGSSPFETVQWHVPGASYADGTFDGSEEPVIVVYGGRALPVRLQVASSERVAVEWGVLNVEGALAAITGELRVGGPVQFFFQASTVDSLELSGPAGELMKVASVEAAGGYRVQFEPTSAGDWSYRGRDDATGEEFRGRFIVLAE